MSAFLRKGFYSLIILCGLITNKLSGQQVVADSIKRTMGFTNDENRIRQLFLLTNAYLNYAPQKALETAAEARVAAVQLGNDSLEAESMLQLGLANSKVGKFNDAIDDYEEAYKLFQKIGDRRNAATSLNDEGEAYNS
ncbi:MAG TPA: hypothetical protein VL651_04865, partial [Bacteroidia bacterium]|nr:hypothetical protein [Bacteroidia bacterium]